ncbi:hypothetical protein [Methylorubrum zatmanii]|nr:hypothetical protein [Methylorubrum zatmanii]
MSQRTKLRNRARRRLGRLPPTPEFIRFGSLFHQDIDFRCDGLEKVVGDVARTFRGEDRKRLYHFVGQILQSDLAPDELDKLWRLTQSDIYINPEGLRFFFTLVRDHLRKGL